MNNCYRFLLLQALAKWNVYYKLLQHKVVIDFQQKEPWEAPLQCLNSECPSARLLLINFLFTT